MSKRIGIFAGAFDPVHTGHIGFALEAAKVAKINTVYFLPERRPRRKPQVEHFGHRTAMIARAIRPHQNLGLLELPDVHFDIARTLPKLQKEFAGSQLVFLMGGEVAVNLPAWPSIEKLMKNCELIIGLRAEQNQPEVTKQLSKISFPKERVTFIKSSAPNISSKKIRESLKHNHTTSGLLNSVHEYARANWLYVSPTNK